VKQPNEKVTILDLNPAYPPLPAFSFGRPETNRNIVGFEILLLRDRLEIPQLAMAATNETSGLYPVSVIESHLIADAPDRTI
jgi:hypothetical protein